ncbi:MAG: hypothetical protein V4580_03110 [Bacteroidota bacterium]
MNNTEFTYLLKELIILKHLMAADNGFIKNFIAIIPATITSAATLCGIWWLFKNNYAKELQFKKENDAKELLLRKEDKDKDLHEKVVKIYGQITGYNYLMMNIILSMNKAQIDGKFVEAMMVIDKANSSALDYKNQYYKYLDELNKLYQSLINVNEKYAAALGEYLCFFPDTKVFLLFDKISKLYMYTHPVNYDTKLTRTEAGKTLEQMILGADNYVKVTYSLHLKSIGDTILKESKIKQ